jgi:hypothetical protein
MTEWSRRGFLRASGAAGALGVLGGVMPSRAWGWSSSGSLAGSGYGVDPAQVWDAVADPVVARLYQTGQVAQVNQLLKSWTTNDQALPRGLPGYLVDFLEPARQLPSWLDREKLAAVGNFYQTRGQYLGLLYGLGSGMMSTAIPNEARAVYYSAGGANMRDRIAKTSKLGYDVGALDAYQPGGQMIVTAVKTRLVHAAVRHLLPQSPYYPSAATPPISKADMLVTWHSLATYSMGKLTAWQVPIPAQQSEAYLHLWQVTAHMLGIEDEYIPATWADANAQRAQVLDPVLGGTPEGIDLAKVLIQLAANAGAGLPREFICAMSRYLVGDRVADSVQIPRAPGWQKTVTAGWPNYLRFREAGISSHVLPAEAYWMFDEMLRRSVLFYFAEGRPIHITMPAANRTF